MRVLHPGQEAKGEQEISPEYPVSQVDDRVENPIGTLQELCQKQQISLPRYEFEVTSEGLRCTVQAMGLKGTGRGSIEEGGQGGGCGGGVGYKQDYLVLPDFSE